MDLKRIAAAIDHAVLKPEATDKDVERECAVAKKYKVATVCVKPCHVALAFGLLKDSEVKVATVVGFPHGGTTTAVKVAECIDAIENGAIEIDMVINLGKLLSGDFSYVYQDIKEVVDAAHSRGALVKVILETSLLDRESKIKACELSEKAGADYVKTSTGFGGGGATIDDILLMKASVSSHIGIKASGGIKNAVQAWNFVEAGCGRIGTSSTEKIMLRNE